MEVLRLLIVDDEQSLLGLLGRYLERMGYEVETSADPKDALAAFAAHPEKYAVVVADLTLGEMNGEEMLRRMREISPSLRGLITSGYPYEPQLPGVGFIQKPFLPDMLVDAIEKVLKKKR